MTKTITVQGVEEYSKWGPFEVLANTSVVVEVDGSTVSLAEIKPGQDFWTTHQGAYIKATIVVPRVKQVPAPRVERLLRDGKDPLACYDCGIHCGNFMVKDSVWAEAFPEYEAVKARLERDYPGEDNRARAMRFVSLCVSCLYNRLGRTFDPEDFPRKIKMNDIIHAAYEAGLQKGRTE